jgi:hypothetical protein
MGIQRTVAGFGKAGGFGAVNFDLKFLREMNVQHTMRNFFATGLTSRVGGDEIIFGQTASAQLSSARPFMFFSSARRAAICFCWGLFLMLPAAVFGQTNYYSKNGTEYLTVSSMPGDQVFPDAAITTNGGFIVWQDNATDGSGWGISARRLDSTLSGTLSTFRVNQQGTNDQENPRVTLLKNGGAAFVWQGGKEGYQHIYARFLTPNNTFLTSTDVAVSTFTNNFQINPAVTTLNNGNVVIVWASFNQASSSSLQDVYAKILSPAGLTISNQFLINQFTDYNQRTPAIAALNNGGFVVTWVSEQQRVVTPNLGANEMASSASALASSAPSADIYARLYTSNGAPSTGEFLVNSDANPCANPAVASASDSSFIVTWDAHDMFNATNSLDIYARTFSSAGIGGATTRVNSYLYGDQYAPRINAIGSEYLIVWTSLGEDGSREGVFGQFVHEDGSLVGNEFQANTTTISRQIQPVVVSDGVNQFLTVWSGFNGLPNSFDLYAQRYLNVASLLQPMGAPFVYAPFSLNTNGVYQPQLQISWPPLLGISVASYEVLVDGSDVPINVPAGNSWTMTVSNGLAASSKHSFQVQYVTTAGTISPVSPAATGTTWSGGNDYGIPFEWLEQYYGNSTANWPTNVSVPLAPGGLTLQQVFLTGGSPLDPSTWLRTSLSVTAQGIFLNWNTQPGLTYQVQTMPSLAAWTNLGSPRFAAGTNDSIFVGGSSSGYYRIMLLRQ